MEIDGNNKINQNKANNSTDSRNTAEERESLLKELIDLERAEPARSQKELRAAIGKLVEIVDGYFAFSGFQFQSAYYDAGTFNLPDAWDHDWMNSVEPELRIIKKRITLCQRFLQLALSEDDCLVANTLSNAIVDLDANHSKLNFYMGVFVGAKMMGASVERLNHFGKRLVEAILSEQPKD